MPTIDGVDENGVHFYGMYTMIYTIRKLDDKAQTRGSGLLFTVSDEDALALKLKFPVFDACISKL